MKKLLLLIFISSLAHQIKSQVVFCPPGAEWSYNYTYYYGGAPLPSLSFPEKITYSGDSIVDSINVKVLSHTRFYLECEEVLQRKTLIKQSGDTVFMRGLTTNHNWEILFDFSAQLGQSWETTIRKNDFDTISVYVYTVTVDSTRTVIENGFNLKQLFVKYKREGTWGDLFMPVVITERIGCNSFLFNYENDTYGFCDLGGFKRFLCYKDTQFGTKQYTAYPCDYVNYTGISEKEKENDLIKLFPNPASSDLTIENTSSSQFLQVEIIDLLGKIIQKQSLESTQTIDISALQNGIYFLQMYDKNKFLVRVKFLKE